MEFVIFVDSDSVPQNIRSIILRAAARTGAAAFFVSDRPLKDVKQFSDEHSHKIRENFLKSQGRGELTKDEKKTLKSRIENVVVPTGENSADDCIVFRVAEIKNKNPDVQILCITHDTPLAKRLLDFGCTVLDDRGGEFTKDTIGERLMERSVNAELRLWGVFENQQKKQRQGDVKAFSDMLDRTIARIS